MRQFLKMGPLTGMLLLFSGSALADYPSAVLATNPLAYFRLLSANDTSQVNGYTSTFQGGATLAPGPPIIATTPQAVSLNGTTGYVSTSLSGGIATEGSVAAWVKLAALPSTGANIQYIAGESQITNDFDLQFTTDNNVRFYFAAGANVAYAPNTATLPGVWHFVVGTFNSNTSTEQMFWDGQLVSTTNSVASSNKFNAFYIGNSIVFTPRFFNGSIGEVAVWGTALTPAQVSSMFAQSTLANSSPSAPALSGMALGFLGVLLVGAAIMALKMTRAEA